MCHFWKDRPDDKPERRKLNRRDEAERRTSHDFEDWNKCPAQQLIKINKESVSKVEARQVKNTAAIGTLTGKLKVYIEKTNAYQDSQNGHIENTTKTVKAINRFLIILLAVLSAHLLGVDSARIWKFVLMFFGGG